MTTPAPRLPWLEPGQSFPDVRHSWGPGTPAPGLLAAGAALDAATLESAYRSGIFPWFSRGQPILWWSPDPRMVLEVQHFRLHRSLRKSLQKFLRDPACELRVDSAFSAVVRACASSPRRGQDGTWILPEMIRAYEGLHEAGLAHSVETWQGGELIGGLYCVAIGRAVYGESMFARASDASKIALCALVSFCRDQRAPQIDCQQNTAHLASLGAKEMPRAEFLRRMAPALASEPMAWEAVTERIRGLLEGLA